MICIGNTHRELYFGGSTVLTVLDVPGLSYGESYPARNAWDKDALPRRIRLEGYVTSEEDTPEGRREEIGRVRRILSGIISNSTAFYVRVDGKTAHLTDGELQIVRESPFTGDTAEHFIIEAKIRGGYFLGESRTCAVTEGVDGFNFPMSTPVTLGKNNGTSYVRVNNGGDVPVGFTATLSPSTTVTSFRFENKTTGKYIHVPQSFGSGDVIKIGTMRDDLYLTLIRGGKEYNMTGVASGESELFLLPVGESVITVGEGKPFEGELIFSERYATF